MRQRKLPINGAEDPCDICIVRPTCVKPCENLKKYIKCIWIHYIHYNGNSWRRTIHDLVNYVEVEYPDLHTRLNIALSPGARVGVTVGLDNMVIFITAGGEIRESIKNTSKGITYGKKN